jgi:hypothetical protein
MTSSLSAFGSPVAFTNMVTPPKATGKMRRSCATAIQLHCQQYLPRYHVTADMYGNIDGNNNAGKLTSTMLLG